MHVSVFVGCCQRTTTRKPLQFQHGNVRVKSWQPMSNSWSTSSQPDFVRAPGRRKTARNRHSKIFYTLCRDPAGLVQITKTPESEKNTKKLRKKYTKSPFPGWGPKIRKKYRKNTKKWTDFWGIFCIFSVIFSYFRAPTREGGFCIFLVLFFVFSGFRGFCNLHQARRVATQSCANVCVCMSTLGQFFANPSSHERVARVFLAIVVWQHPILSTMVLTHKDSGIAFATLGGAYIITSVILKQLRVNAAQHINIIPPPPPKKLGDKIWTRTFFSQTFRAPPGYPSKIPGYPAQKV